MRRQGNTPTDHTSRILPLFLALIGFVLLGYSLLQSSLRQRALILAKDQVEAYRAVEPTRPPAPTHISIPSFVDVGVESMALTGAVWGVSPDKATYLIQSARPGEKGNIIVYGHNKRRILGNIRALKGGEKVTLTTSEGQVRVYRVESLQEVKPSEVALLQPTDTEILTIYTCSGPLDSLRFVVRAVPI